MAEGSRQQSDKGSPSTGAPVNRESFRFRNSLKEKCQAAHCWLSSRINKIPILLVPLLPASYVALYLWGLLLFLPFSLIIDLQWGQPEELRYAAAIVFLLVVVVSVAVWASYYVLLMGRSFVHAVSSPAENKLRRVIECVVVAVSFFSVVHYYCHLFSSSGAYKNMQALVPPRGWPDYGNDIIGPMAGILDRLLFWPGVDAVLDFVYFSAVTLSTVGYGDFTPSTGPAKFAVIGEIVVGFAMIVVALNQALSNNGTQNTESLEKDQTD